MRHIKTLPREDVKVLIGDNLAAHLSPYVLRNCEHYNIRFMPRFYLNFLLLPCYGTHTVPVPYSLFYYQNK